MLLLLDFDGTLVDIVARYTKVFADCIQHLTGLRPGTADYIQRRRLGTDESGLVRPYLRNGNALAAYKRIRKVLLEDPDYLRLDSLFPETIAFLDALREHKIHLITHRIRFDRLMNQIHQLGLQPYLKSIHTVVNGDHVVQDKAKVFTALAQTHRGKAWVIGDSPTDMAAATLAGLPGLGVATGLFSAEPIATGGAARVFDRLSTLWSFLENPEGEVTEQ